MSNFDPMKEVKKVGEGLTRVFEDAVNYAKGSSYSVPVDIYQTDEHLVLVAGPLYQVKPETLDVAINGDMLTISGETDPDPEIPDEAYIKRERRFGEFRRTVKLPQPFDGTGTKAKLKHNILKVFVPKGKIEVETPLETEEGAE
jgi:HSP20 family protein